VARVASLSAILHGNGYPIQNELADVNLAKHRLSDNVGGVKYFLSTLQPALKEERLSL